MQKYKEPILYMIIIIVALILALVSLKPLVVNSFNLGNTIKSKEVELADSGRKLDALKTAEDEKMSTSEQSKKIYKPDTAGMDAESSFSVLLGDIIEMAKYNQVKVYSVSYIYNPPDDEFVKGATSTYNVCQLNMQLVSDYRDLQTFLEDIYKYPYFVTIDKIELAPYMKDKKILLINLQLKLYASK